MSKLGLKIILLLGIVFCMESLQTETSAEMKADKKAKTASKIPVPDGGFTIVLREPMGENPRIVKVSRDSKGNTTEEPVQGFTVSLPKNTLVFFRVDQVNTILYDIKITVGQEKSGTQSSAASKSGTSTSQSSASKSGTSTSQSSAASKDSTSFTGILDFLLSMLKVISKVGLVGDESDEIKKAKDTLKILQCKLQAAEVLNSELDELLYKSEMPQFCGFKSIQTQAAKTSNDTADKLYYEGKAALAAVHQVYNAVKDDSDSPVLKRFPVLTELGDPSKGTAKEVLDVFVQPAKKLRMIETAKWRKDDTQERVLKENISYTCVISPAAKPSAVKLPEKYPELRAIEFVVTVNRTPDLSGRKVTFGSFLTHLHDDTYVNVDKKIEIGVQDRFAEGFAVLTHIPLRSYNVDAFEFLKFRWAPEFLKFRWAPALSGGLGLGSISDSDGKFSLGQLPTLLGGSLLFAAPKSESLLAFTVGGTLRPVKRLNGYSVGNTFPAKGDVTRPVRTFGWFFAITLSYDIWGALRDKLDEERKK